MVAKWVIGILSPPAELGISNERAKQLISRLRQNGIVGVYRKGKGATVLSKDLHEQNTQLQLRTGAFPYNP